MTHTLPLAPPVTDALRAAAGPERLGGRADPPVVDDGGRPGEHARVRRVGDRDHVRGGLTDLAGALRTGQQQRAPPEP